MLIRLQWGRKGRSTANKKILKEQCVTFHMDALEKKNKVSEIAEDRILQLLLFFIVSVCNNISS